MTSDVFDGDGNVDVSKVSLWLAFWGCLDVIERFGAVGWWLVKVQRCGDWTAMNGSFSGERGNEGLSG